MTFNFENIEMKKRTETITIIEKNSLFLIVKYTDKNYELEMNCEKILEHNMLCD